MKPTKPLTRAEQFFFDNAEWSWDPKTEGEPWDSPDKRVIEAQLAASVQDEIANL